MSSSIVFIDNLMVLNPTLCTSIHSKSTNFLPNFRVRGDIGGRRNRRTLGLVVPYAKKRKGLNPRNKSWWQRFFFEEDGNWFGLKEEDLEEFEVENENEVEGFMGDGVSEEDKFEAWKSRAEALIELREAQEGIRNEENRYWEDWLVFEEGNGGVKREWDYDDVDDVSVLKEGDVGGDPDERMPERGLVKTIEDFVLGKENDDLLYEDRVFQFASRNSAKFMAVCIIIPWALDFLVHDYVLMPFLDRYVKTVPLAAELLDVRRSQKLEMVKELNIEKARLRFEAEIGKAPPLSEEETWWELRHKALELRDEWRLANRNAFANIWSDMVFGVSLFLLLYFNQSKVALLKFTGYKIINNISDTGKAFLIILVTDIFLGYHSESGWQTLCEIFIEHYGLEIDQSALTIFICLVPVIMDACVKLWLFKYLPRLSPKVFNIFHEMKRH